MRRALVLAVVLVSAVALTACSGDDDSSNTRARSTATTVSAAQLGADGAAIQHLVDYLSGASSTSPADGLAAFVASDYFVWNRTYTADQCMQYFRARLGYLAGARVVGSIVPGSVQPAPSSPSASTSAGPPERRYRLALDIHVIGDPVTTSKPARATVEVAVLPDGTAKTIAPCA
jgi:hypothetical protein